MSACRTPAALIAALTLSTLAGCATTDCAAPVGNPRLTPTQVAATAGHTGELVRWGGTLVEARNLRDSTELEIVGLPLDRCGVPRTGESPIGRFIAVVPGYLETAQYRRDRLVTATGMITGTREGTVGDAPYRFPVLSNGQVRLWPEAPPGGSGPGRVRPWVSIGIGGGSGGWYGGAVGGGVSIPF